MGEYLEVARIRGGLRAGRPLEGAVALLACGFSEGFEFAPDAK